MADILTFKKIQQILKTKLAYLQQRQRFLTSFLQKKTPATEKAKAPEGGNCEIENLN